MKTYIVVEGDRDRDLLRGAIAAENLEDVQFVVATGRQYLSTMAANLLINKQAPVLLVCDAETLDRDLIEERHEWFRANSERFAVRVIPYKIFFAAPEIAALLIDADVLRKAYGIAPPESVLVMGRYAPHDALNEMNRLSGTTRTPVEILAALGTEEMERVRNHAIMKEITTFLDRAKQYEEAGQARSLQPT